ncbi:MAG: lipopolysaccharide heptosyltransferase II [Deltaproteobacteria bacterium]|nr:lipopolysaccharide heptosyltransferase II [Deltaproteobacteria bacterium]
MDSQRPADAMKPALTSPQKILIVKLSAIGDVIQTLPMLAALRRRFPEAQIDWVVEEEAAGLLWGYPGIDRVLVSRRKSWQRKIWKRRGFGAALREILRFVKDLREIEYDWVIDNHGVLKSGIIVALCRGDKKIGYRATAGIAGEGNYFFTNERHQPLSIERHARERYLDLVGQLGVSSEDVSLEFPIPPDSLETVRRILDESGFNVHPLAIIHPLAKWDTKQWAPEKFSGLADRLSERGVRVAITGSRGDATAVEGILRGIRFPDRILNLAGKTNLGELAALFSLADVVITPDTGPMHLAAAVKAPLIALFGPTAPWRTGPYGNGHVILRKELTCSPCFRKKCPTGECLDQITVEEVLKAAEEKLRERRALWP